MAGEIVTAVYKPHEGKEKAMIDLIRDHVPMLRRVGLATERPAMLLRATKSGALIEIFEWVSNEAATEAHDHPEVQKVWGAMMEIADFPALGSLKEAETRFPHFEPVDGVVS